MGTTAFLFRSQAAPPRDLSLVGDATRGSYLLRLGDCITCHTDKAAKTPELAGGAALKSPFGTFYAPNITSDPTAGIGAWSLAEFSRAMSEGIGKDGEHLYPAFPYQHYTMMTDQEVADLYAALLATAPTPRPSRPHEVGFPFNVRLGLQPWKNLFFEPARYVPDAAKSEAWNRGRYLVDGPGHCAMCHSPRNLLGAVEAGRELSGNPAGGAGGRTPSITAAGLIAKDYTPQTLESMLLDGYTPDEPVFGTAMGEVVEDGTAHWTEADRAAVAEYLFSVE